MTDDVTSCVTLARCVLWCYYCRKVILCTSVPYGVSPHHPQPYAIRVTQGHNPHSSPFSHPQHPFPIRAWPSACLPPTRPRYTHTHSHTLAHSWRHPWHKHPSTDQCPTTPTSLHTPCPHPPQRHDTGHFFHHHHPQPNPLAPSPPPSSRFSQLRQTPLQHFNGLRV